MKDSIKAGELRLRNWVEHIEKGYCQVLRIAVDELLDSVNSIERSLSQYEPIPLTKEVLEKCGFEYINLPSNFNGGNGGYRKLIMSSAQRYILLTGRSHFICGMYDSDDVKYYSPLTDFSYLHQLQNLYFAMAGKELEITL